ncbi:MAG: hypothetical protein DRP47_08375 [Candidatus Zixiibacteriota bacterium]|nr:MAG: hypothetical protein DRP47_08375 [candidate division Zixibacteria bacterium]
MIPIIWKEFKALQTSLMMIIFHFITPLFLLIFFAVALGRNLASFSYGGSAIDYLDYFTPGLVGYITFMTFQISLTLIRHDRMSGMLGIIVLSRGGLGEYLGGKLIAQLAINIAKIVLLIFLAMLISSGQVELFSLQNLGLFLLTILLGSSVWLSLGLALGLFLKRDDVREVLMMFISMPLIFSSSMYYDISRAPAWIQAIGIVNPLTYTCNLTRRAYLLPDMGSFSSDLGILACMAVVAMALAVFVSRRIDY